MKHTPKRATAQAFVVITSFPRYTECIGTKEQLISLYPTIESRFLDGNKYKKYGGEFHIGGKKGGLFKVRKFHEEQTDSKINYAYLEVPLDQVTDYGTPDWTCRGTTGTVGGKFAIGHTYRDLTEAACLISNALKRERDFLKRSRLTLVGRGAK